ncbi:hypothetical protein D3C73_1326560 [compost metagenome]
MVMTARQLMDMGRVVPIAALALVLMLQLLVSYQTSQSVTWRWVIDYVTVCPSWHTSEILIIILVTGVTVLLNVLSSARSLRSKFGVVIYLLVVVLIMTLVHP